MTHEPELKPRKRRYPSQRKNGGPQRQREVTSERLLAAAEQLFLERGFRAAWVSDIAEAAGYTTGAIYSSFGGKDDLFLAVYRRKAEQQEAAWRAAIRALIHPTNTDDIDPALARPLLEPAWYAVVFEFLSYAARDERLRREVAEIYRGGTALVAEVLQEVDPSSPLPVERLAPIVIALVRGLSLTWFVDPAASDVALLADAVAVLLGDERARPTDGASNGQDSQRSATPADDSLGGRRRQPA
jgi:AcrR family transcriptional regulator